MATVVRARRAPRLPITPVEENFSTTAVTTGSSSSSSETNEALLVLLDGVSRAWRSSSELPSPCTASRRFPRSVCCLWWEPPRSCCDIHPTSPSYHHHHQQRQHSQQRRWHPWHPQRRSNISGSDHGGGGGDGSGVVGTEEKDVEEEEVAEMDVVDDDSRRNVGGDGTPTRSARGGGREGRAGDASEDAPSLGQAGGFTSTRAYASRDPDVHDDADAVGASTTWAQARETGRVMTPESFAAAVAADPASYVVLHVTDGLGNRLRAVAAGKALARDKRRTLVIVWERDATLDAPLDVMLTPSFLRGAYLLERLPSDFFLEVSATRGCFSPVFDASTEEGKGGVAAQLDDAQSANWARALCVKSYHAELRKTAE